MTTKYTCMFNAVSQCITQQQTGTPNTVRPCPAQHIMTEVPTVGGHHEVWSSAQCHQH